MNSVEYFHTFALFLYFRQLILYSRYRKEARISDDNIFLFPSVSSKRKHLDASFCLKKFANRCGADHPERLTATYLRKQVATTSQMLSMDHNDLSNLAKFMGHTDAVHQANYRMPEINIYVTKMSRFLSAATGEDVNLYKGMKIDEIPVEIPEMDHVQVIPDVDDIDLDEMPFDKIGTEVHSGLEEDLTSTCK